MKYQIAKVATDLGYTLIGRLQNSCACPSCKAETRHPGRNDHRGAVGFTRDGCAFRCFECDARGDTAEFMALHHGITREEARGKLTWSRFTMMERRDPEPQYPPQIAVERAWSESLTLPESSVVYPRGIEWVESRGLDVKTVVNNNLARVMDSKDPPDFIRPFIWAHRLLVPLYNKRGEMCSVLGRRLVGDGAKTLSPAGFSTAGLVMCNLAAKYWLGKVGRTPKDIIFVEGIPDFLHAASTCTDDLDHLVFGVESGAWTIDHANRLPLGSIIKIATHNDAAGKKYAGQIAATLKGCGHSIEFALRDNG